MTTPYTADLTPAEIIAKLEEIRREVEANRRDRVRFILLARENGATWEQIGSALGITKSGARNFITREEGAA